MNVNSYQYKGEEYDDNSDNESFQSAQSALCEMYNDVLCHAVIPEEDAVYFADAIGGDEPSHAVNRFRPLTRKISFASCRSLCGSSIASSYLLSVGDTHDDDDLSFMTEGSFDDGYLSTDPSIELSENFQSLGVSKGVSSSEFSDNVLSIETSQQTDQDTHTEEPNLSSPDRTSKVKSTANSPYKNNICGHEDCGIRNSLNLSDLDAACVSNSVQTSYPDCCSTYDSSEVSELTHL